MRELEIGVRDERPEGITRRRRPLERSVPARNRVVDRVVITKRRAPRRTVSDERESNDHKSAYAPSHVSYDTRFIERGVRQQG
jgi:hypothetical protein